MHIHKLFSMLLISTILFSLSCQEKTNSDKIVLLNTNFGDIKIKLYDSTPLHRDNFLKLVESDYYNGILFHRIIKNFMIQAGDFSTRVPALEKYQDSLSRYTIPAEFVSGLFHKKGAVAAARTGNDINPEMRSSGTQFYIVQGTVQTDSELDAAEEIINKSLNQALFIKLIRHISDSIHSSNLNFSDDQIHELATIRMFDILSTTSPYTIPQDQRQIYKTIGGVPRLDRTYTVFGEVIEGIETVDKIASVSTDNYDKPLTDVRIIKARVLKK